MSGIVVKNKSGGKNYANCAGVYKKTNKTCQNYEVYLCESQSRFLAFNGGSWCITGTQWMDDIVNNNKSGWGAFHASSNGNVSILQSEWKEYTINKMDDAAKKIYVNVKNKSTNYANCDGEYELVSNKLLQKHPIYINKKKQRFIGYNGGCWVLTGVQWYDQIVNGDKSGWGGFHSNTNGDTSIINSEWKDYQITIQPKQQNNDDNNDNDDEKKQQQQQEQEGTDEGDEEDFVKLLKTWKLIKYKDVLEGEGWDDPEYWYNLKESDLELMKFSKGHRVKFLEKIKGKYPDKFNKKSDNNNNDGNELNIGYGYDPMTKLPLKSAYNKMIHKLCDAKDSNNHKFTLLCLDMDNLKKLNKKSQDTANAVILSIGNILKEYVEYDGIDAFRPHQGGDEFIMILQNKNELEIAEAIRKQVEDMGSTTLSVGIAVRKSNEIGKTWYNRANMALEKAKDDGKNMCIVAPDL